MPKRTICIQSPCSIRTRHRSLLIETDTRTCEMPLEDIWVLVIESHLATISIAALSALADAGIGAVVCGKSHMPNGICLPLAGHYGHAGIVDAQLSMPKPLQKRIWQRIVATKIMNQASALSVLGFEKEADELRVLGSNVLSGDTSNREAVAAALYFKTLITEGTRRDSTYTALLDYGYAVLRAGIAREVVAGGWLASHGIHHCSNVNAFNLVDDLIEPFRPVVDLIVFDSLKGSEELSTESKQALSEVFEYGMVLDGKTYTVQSAITRMVESLRDAVLFESAASLLLPEVVGLRKVPVKEG